MKEWQSHLCSGRGGYGRNLISALDLFIYFWTGGPEVERRENGINKGYKEAD